MSADLSQDRTSPIAAALRPKPEPKAEHRAERMWRRTARAQIRFIREQLLFPLNKAIYFRLSHVVEGTAAATIKTGANGLLRQIRITRCGKVIGELEYFAGVDENGMRRGGHPPCSYMHDLIVDQAATERQKLRIVRELIAQLPGNALLGLTAGPHAHDLAILRRAFAGAGFRTWPQTTFIYSPPAGGDLIASMRGARIRTALRAARRELDVIDISPAEFVRFFTRNLERAGKQNFCSPAIDLALLSEGVQRDPPQARLLAARRKATEENPHPSRIESAIALAWGDDGLVKLHRITYPLRGHPHATKLLILEGCATAARYGKELDTDAATEGGKELYRRFGSFTPHMRHEFVRYPLRWYIQRAFPAIARRLGLSAEPARPVFN